MRSSSFGLSFRPEFCQQLPRCDSWSHIRLFGFLRDQFRFRRVFEFISEAADVVFVQQKWAKVHLCGLTCELSGCQRQDARPGMQIMPECCIPGLVACRWRSA